MINLKESRIGQTCVTKFNELIEITDYKDANHIEVTFLDYNYKISATYGQFKKGTIKSPYCRTLCGFGFLGEGDYRVKIDGKLTKEYQVWSDMIKRCYSENQLNDNPSYVGCSVDETWSNFQNFAKWMTENYYEVEGQRMSLDKDILLKNNKRYSPETCCFAPQSINTLIIKCDAIRGKLPIGVSFHKATKKYAVNWTGEYLGLYNTPTDAFLAYKKVKESRIKEMADTYRTQIPDNIYMALMQYKIEISD